ncbi:hypothetical protein HNR73_003439 [Phytomonospora endophytica]|uniref:Uncharacterized protein n=1 Tax=Phytomonospora endophytica TaxID=714109 RepID=A0A841FII3_9ACTN|nr:hypothetical protein [Phytomonospora endophytica]MBB6035575.1 hypothetical protein [Phytomonospora endophytica]
METLVPPSFKGKSSCPMRPMSWWCGSQPAKTIGPSTGIWRARCARLWARLSLPTITPRGAVVEPEVY